MHFNLPNILTFSRIAAIPVLLALFMVPGDVVEVEISGIGTLRNTIVDQ